MQKEGENVVAFTVDLTENDFMDCSERNWVQEMLSKPIGSFFFPLRIEKISLWTSNVENKILVVHNQIVKWNSCVMYSF